MQLTAHAAAPAGSPVPRRACRPSRPAVLGAVAGLLLFAAAALVPGLTGIDVHANVYGWAPLKASWHPRIGAGTLPALALGIALAVGGPGLAVRLGWRRLLLVAWVTTWLWTVSLALVDGTAGVDTVFSRPSEYLYDAERLTSLHDALGGFVDRIPLGPPDHWQTHVAGHPAGALLLFAGLARIGFGDPFALGMLVLTLGATVPVALLVSVRTLASEDMARRAAPFLVAAPAAIWVAVSADALYAAVGAWGLTALALAATRSRRRVGYAVCAGLLLGSCVYLSYGLVLLVILAGAVLLTARSLAPVPWALLGAAVVAAAFTAGGFLWWQAYEALRGRYYAGLGGVRPYWYWLWGNLAAVTATTGLAVWAALPATAARLRAATAGRAPERAAGTLALLGTAGVLCMLVATLSAMSKAEVERIWLPFAWWALLLPALLSTRDRRWALTLQVATALATSFLLETGW